MSLGATLESLSWSAAAAARLVRPMLLIPDTKPVTDNKSQVEFIQHRNGGLPVTIHAIGAITKNLEVVVIWLECMMCKSGAAWLFADGLSPVQSSGGLAKAQQYAKAFKGVIIQIPDDTSISPNGSIHEGIISTQLGLPETHDVGRTHNFTGILNWPVIPVPALILPA